MHRLIICPPDASSPRCDVMCKGSIDSNIYAGILIAKDSNIYTMTFSIVKQFVESRTKFKSITI